MDVLKRSALILIFSSMMGVPAVYAEDEVASLPTIRLMAESELREEVGIVPYQEDENVRQALQHHLYKVNLDMQNQEVSESVGGFNYQPQAAQPDLSYVPAILQQYILAVANGFQSSDPTNGVFKMLEPLNINRDNAIDFQNGTMKVDLNDLLKLQQQIRDGLNPPPSPLFPR
ncbi:hypothetical protein [Acinetobacter venetianus]